MIGQKERVVYKIRRSSIVADQIKKFKSEGLGATTIANRLKIHIESSYQIIKPKKIFSNILC